MFGLHGLSTIPSGVTIPENLPFQWFPLNWITRTHYTDSTFKWRLLNRQHNCWILAKSVDESDQPVYKLYTVYELQLRYSDRIGPEKYFCLFRSRHIEKSILLCGSLIEGSGLNQIMASYGLSIARTDSLVSVDHIKRARYCIQVAASVMVSLLRSAHKKSGGKGPMLQWLKNKSEESGTCHYWYTIIDLMLNLLIMACNGVLTPSPPVLKFLNPPNPQTFYSPFWLEMAASAFFTHGYF